MGTLQIARPYATRDQLTLRRKVPSGRAIAQGGSEYNIPILGQKKESIREYTSYGRCQLTPSMRTRCRRAIAQGSSEYNITILVEQKESIRALRAVHARFYLATLPLAIGLVGPGLIGATLLAQIQQQLTVRPWLLASVHWRRGGCGAWQAFSWHSSVVCATLAPLFPRHHQFQASLLSPLKCVSSLLQELRDNMDTDVRVLGIASSSRMLLSESGIVLDSWREAFDRCALRSRGAIRRPLIRQPDQCCTLCMSKTAGGVIYASVP